MKTDCSLLEIKERIEHFPLPTPRQVRETDQISDLGWPQNSAIWLGSWFHHPLLSPTVGETPPYLCWFRPEPTAGGDMLERDEGPSPGLLQPQNWGLFRILYSTGPQSLGEGDHLILCWKCPLMISALFEHITEPNLFYGGGLHRTKTNNSLSRSNIPPRENRPHSLCLQCDKPWVSGWSDPNISLHVSARV